MEKDLIDLLLANAPLVSLVGDRVTPVARTQGDPLPAVVTMRISGAPEYADDGEVGIQNARMQIDCWGESYESAKDLAAAVTTALSAVRDIVQGATTFIYIILDDVRDSRESGFNNAEYLFRTSLDFIVWTNF